MKMWGCSNLLEQQVNGALLFKISLKDLSSWDAILTIVIVALQVGDLGTYVPRIINLII
jgi:hypothetical protein